MNKKILVGSCVLGLLVAFSACKPDPAFTVDTNNGEEPVSIYVPDGWPQPFYKYESNPISQESFKLGRKLFYDTRLSRDNSTSCGSCHQAFAAFAHADHDLSHGVDGLLGTRNSPPIFNMNWHTSFFWDGGVNHLEVQPLNPIQNPVEMDENLTSIIAKLNGDETYKEMFTAAWGTEEINSARMFKSLALFMGAIISDNSKYDQYTRGETMLTQQELAGLTVYENNCATCHKAPLFTDFSFRNNGLPPSSVNDSGRAIITRKPEDMYRFKVPTLRNLGYTQPYMHDGRINTLEGVLDHYANGIHQSPTLDPVLQNGIQLSSQERTDLLAFLNTLNDESMVKDTRFHEVQ